jgi:succinate dehydrogenase/fumarate reductase flavoprotein subunit
MGSQRLSRSSIGSAACPHRFDWTISWIHASQWVLRLRVEQAPGVDARMSGHTLARTEAHEGWHAAADVIVVGYGYAGAVAAIEAHDAGADVLLIEKMPDPGGISITSGGNVRIVEDAEEGFRHLQASSAGTTPDPVLRALAAGMAEISAYFAKLARVSGASINRRQADGNYPFPGTKTFGYVSIDQVPGFDAERTYPFVSSYLPIHRAAGVRLFKVLQDNISSRGLRVELSTPANRLITGAHGEICGVMAQYDGRMFAIKARRAVVLACGGFEANPEMQRQYWQEKPVLNAAYMGNTGDGILMAQAVGAALWHMWHYHGVYGFRHPDPAYPFGIRPKRLPDWIPGEDTRAEVKVPWIIVDRCGRRYMNEYQPYTQDTTWRAMAIFDGQSMSYPRIPSYMIMDEAGRGAYPIVSPTFNDRRFKFSWSEQTLRELESRILCKRNSLAELAAAMDVREEVLAATIAAWNAACDAGEDALYGRPPTSMLKITTPPYYCAEVWPVCSNTHGGPVHDAEQRILNVFGEPIPRLFAAGELGGVFGHLYMSGGNLAECFVGGWTAGRNAARLPAWTSMQIDLPQGRVVAEETP